MPNFVQEYRSIDLGMPVLSGTAGALIALLDAVLVNGGTTQTVTSIVESGTTYTATIPTDATLESGDYLVLAGASPAGANGTFPITRIDSTHFSYQGPGGLGTITGSITYRRAPLGWTKPFTGTNTAAFLSQSGITGRTQMYVRIDETGATAGTQKECAVRGYMGMSDISTGTDPFPTAVQMANGVCWRKSLTADATARPWVIVGDGTGFYMIVNSDNMATAGRCLVGCGAFVSFKSSDAYGCFLSGNGAFNSGANSATQGVSTGSGINCPGPLNATSNAGNCIFIPRAYSQVGGAVSASAITYVTSGGDVIGRPLTRWQPYPNGPDGGLWVFPIFLVEGPNGHMRGRAPGLYDHPHSTMPLAEFDTASNIAGLPGAVLTGLYCACSTSGGVTGVAMLDRAGPWN